jgi:prepilin-type N-terminal cleavage/methylation domain-containing protein
MAIINKKIRSLKTTGQKGFTLLETVVAVGIGAFVLVTLYVAFAQGVDISRDVIMQQDADRSLNNASVRFGDDMRGAVYFWSGVTTDENDAEVLDKNTLPREVTFVILRSDHTTAWVKYELAEGILTDDTYLVRLSDYETPGQLALTYVAQNVANLLFIYYDADGRETADLTQVAAVDMVLTIDTGVATKERNIYVKLRNENLGLMIPSYDFESERDAQLIK